MHYLAFRKLTKTSKRKGCADFNKHGAYKCEGTFEIKVALMRGDMTDNKHDKDDILGNPCDVGNAKDLEISLSSEGFDDSIHNKKPWFKKNQGNTKPRRT